MWSLLIFAFTVTLPLVHGQCLINAKFCDTANMNRPVPPYSYDISAAVFGATACTLDSGFLRNFGCQALFVPTNASINYTPEPLCQDGAWTVSSPTPADEAFFTCSPGPSCPYTCGPSPAACKDNITSGEVSLGSFVQCAAGRAPLTVPYCGEDGQRLQVTCTDTPNTAITSAPAWLRWAEATSKRFPAAFSYAYTASTCNSICGFVTPSTGVACRSDSYTCSACMNCTTTPQASQLGSLLDTIQVRKREAAAASVGGRASFGEVMHVGMEAGHAALRSAVTAAVRQTADPVGLVQVTCTEVTEEAHMACLAAAACDGLIVEETVCVVGGRTVACPSWSVGPSSSKKGLLGLLGLIALVPIGVVLCLGLIIWWCMKPREHSYFEPYTPRAPNGVPICGPLPLPSIIADAPSVLEFTPTGSELPFSAAQHIALGGVASPIHYGGAPQQFGSPPHSPPPQQQQQQQHGPSGFGSPPSTRAGLPAFPMGGGIHAPGQGGAGGGAGAGGRAAAYAGQPPPHLQSGGMGLSPPPSAGVWRGAEVDVSGGDPGSNENLLG